MFALNRDSPDSRRVRGQDRPFERLEQWAAALITRKRRSKPPVGHAAALNRAAQNVSTDIPRIPGLRAPSSRSLGVHGKKVEPRRAPTSRLARNVTPGRPEPFHFIFTGFHLILSVQSVAFGREGTLKAFRGIELQSAGDGVARCDTGTGRDPISERSHSGAGLRHRCGRGDHLP
jgi:hypothetical protein